MLDDILTAVSELFSMRAGGRAPAGAGALSSPGEVLTLDAAKLRPVAVRCKCGKVHNVTPAAVIGEAVTGRLTLPAGDWNAAAIYAPDGRLLAVNLVRR